MSSVPVLQFVGRVHLLHSASELLSHLLSLAPPYLSMVAMVRYSSSLFGSTHNVSHSCVCFSPHHPEPLLHLLRLILTCLHKRFIWDTICTSIGSPALIAVNPYKHISSNTDSVLQKHARLTGHSGKQALPTSFSLLTMPTMYYMYCTAWDQSLIIRCVLLLLDVCNHCSACGAGTRDFASLKGMALAKRCE